MILQFDKKYNFAEKIINSIPTQYFEFATKTEYLDELCKYREIAITKDIKIHTIRNDFKNRWNVGRSIHFCEWSAKPYNSRNIQFAPLMKVINIQDISIFNVKGFSENQKYSIYKNSFHSLKDLYFNDFLVIINGGLLSKNSIEILAENEGFNNVNSFIDYFNKDFKGKIIHWTDFEY